MTPELDKAEQESRATSVQEQALADVAGSTHTLQAALAAKEAECEALRVERDDAREYGAQARIRENEAEDKRIREHDRAEAAEAKLKRTREALDLLVQAAEDMSYACNSGSADDAIEKARDVIRALASEDSAE